MKWRGKSKYPPEQERIRRLVMAEAEADRKYRKFLQAIKDKMDLYGEDSLTAVEIIYVDRHRDFFYPEEEGVETWHHVWDGKIIEPWHEEEG